MKTFVIILYAMWPWLLKIKFKEQHKRRQIEVAQAQFELKITWIWTIRLDFNNKWTQNIKPHKPQDSDTCEKHPARNGFTWMNERRRSSYPQLSIWGIASKSLLWLEKWCAATINGAFFLHLISTSCRDPWSVLHWPGLISEELCFHTLIIW